MRRGLIATGCMFNFLMAGITLAQNAPSMLSTPWQEGRQRAETLDDLLFFDQGHTQGSNLDTGMFYWDSYVAGKDILSVC